MSKLLVALCLLASVSFVFSTLTENNETPFLNVYMKIVNTKTLQVIGLYWGPSGTFELHKNPTNPDQSLIHVNIVASGNNSKLTALNQTQIQALQQYVVYAKILDSITLQFPASQIALSEYDSKYCGLFSDEEYTFDIDMPINPIGKDESSNTRLEFSFLFDLPYEDQMNQVYSFLDDICIKRAH